MAHKLAASSQKVAYRILVTQVIISAVVAMVFLLFGTMAAASSVIGGLVAVIPNGVFVLITHRHGGAQSAKKIINTFYIGEALKMLLTAGMFAAAFIFFPVEILPLMLTFILCMLAYFIAGLSASRN